MAVGRIQGLDVIRGFAILLVLARHSWPGVFGGGGIVGVVVFFTLSGYLITGLLTADLHKYGKVRYGRFYRNRAIRLLPALVFMLIGFVIIEGIFNVSGTRGSVLRSVIVSITYTMNLPFNHGSPNLSHLWTLANEEQFYLIWPIILAFGIRFRKLKWVVAASAILLMLMLIGTIVIAGDDVGRIYTLPTTWTISMVVGAAAQLGQKRIDGWLSGRRTTIGLIVGVVGLVALAFVPEAKSSTALYVVGGTLIGLLTILMIWKLREVPVVSVWWRPLLGLGIISYAAYLWNYPITRWLRDVGVEFWAPAAVALTIVAAAISWFAVEKPFNAWKQSLDRRHHLRQLDPVFAGEQEASATAR